MARKPIEGESEQVQYRDMDDYSRLSPNMQRLYDLVGGVEGIERGLKSDNPIIRHGAAIVILELLKNLSKD